MFHYEVIQVTEDGLWCENCNLPSVSVLMCYVVAAVFALRSKDEGIMTLDYCSNCKSKKWS